MYPAGSSRATAGDSRPAGRVRHGGLSRHPGAVPLSVLLASANEKVRRDSVRYIMDNVDNASCSARLRCTCARA